MFVERVFTRRRRRRARRSFAAELVMLAFLAYFMLPLFWLFIASTKTLPDLYDSFGLWFAHDFNLGRNIHELLQIRTLDGGTFLVWIRNSMLYSVSSAVIAALLATAAGYGFSKFDWRWREGVFWFVLGAVMVPTQALATPTYLLAAKVGLTNNPLSIILPCSVSPFGVYLMRIYADRAIPGDLIEAARLDGAGELRIFVSIAFRLLAPGFVTVMLFAFVATWNNYFLPLIMLSEPKWYPLTVGIREIGTTGVLAGSLVTIVPLIIAFVLLQRFWESGLAAGGVNAA